MSKRDIDYNIGLDIGTTSVGWAVTDNNYNLLNIKKKNLWGVRLFKEAETAADTRLQRSMRRRYRRRRNRLNWLDEIFAPELNNIDESFLLRMKNSWVSKKDTARSRDPYNLFIDETYTDIDYFKEFPTIFHLRKKLIESNEKRDIRLVYLAIHNILKYRGNFTFENQKFDVSKMGEDFAVTLKDFIDSLSEYGIEVSEDIDYTSLGDALLQGNRTRSKKVDDALTIIGPSKEQKQAIKNMLSLLVGNIGNLVKLFDLETSEKVTLSLSSKSIEDDLTKVDDFIDEDQKIILDSANIIYSSIVLKGFLGESKYLSQAKVQSYIDHKDDLKKLKDIWMATDDSKLVKKSRQQYDQYVNAKYDEFYKDIAKFLKKAQPKELANEALEKIELNTYLPKQRSRDNAVIPYQLNENELIAILDNQEKYYPFLAENRDKILSLINFRIPYYVGPLQHSDKSRFAWMARKADGPIRPWNFEEKVDLEASSDKFIKRMTATDTYLIGEPVLPKQSMIYQRYEVLSELNNTRVIEAGGRPHSLDVEVKQRIYNELFRTRKTVSVKALKDWLIKESIYQAPIIQGLADKTKYLSSLSTFNDFKKLFGENYVADPNNLAQLEELAEWLTVFEDKKVLKMKLQNSSYDYPTDLINKIASMRFQSWGKLSKKLLAEFRTETKLADVPEKSNFTILELMWSTQLNFMQLIRSDKYTFEKQINDYNVGSNNEKSQFEMVNELHGSPAVKRGISQSLSVVKDIVKFMGHDPNRIYLEFTRSDEDSKITQSRYSRVNNRYKEISNAAKSLPSEFQAIKGLQTELEEHKNELGDERLMLYFLQMGRGMYSNQPIDINHIHTAKYHVDHILPQSFIKDDSLENKALVLAEENERKIDSLLIDPKIIRRNKNFWDTLKEQNLMGLKKYSNLNRTSISDNQMKGFINRQLVQTSQMVKNVTNILNAEYKDTECVETRAGLSSEFRKAFSNLDKENFRYQYPEFVKNRNVNDHHHAQDAYLACVVGQYKIKKYIKNKSEVVYGQYSAFLENLKKDTRKKNGKMPRYVQNGFIIGSMFDGETHVDDNGEIIWDQTIKYNIRKAFNYKQYHVVRQTYTRHGALFNQTLWNPQKSDKLIPLKKDLDPSIYGGYNNDVTAYTVLLDIDGKKKLANIPVRIANEIENKQLVLEEWIKSTVKYKKTLSILMERVPVNQHIYSEAKGHLLLSSATETNNHTQLFLDSKYTSLMTILEHNSESKYSEIISKWSENTLEEMYELLIKKMEMFYPFYKGELAKLKNNFDEFKVTGHIDQINTLQTLLIFLHANPANPKIKIGKFGSAAFGRKNGGTELSNVDFIYESPTGLFQNKITIK
ncbi:type II CRISPR RNA-guided endonuclease Cas9 [Companilactobacillus mishanensis]|uniref:type II CRISPR RNA-guided endonuclease Cas9 n=1 Tax=Companilactobacillus mishanensis TaxID=2486008 RepID=UPI0012955F9B|nr:type II CRISPR RNA-guided endonuclease Cas9 [Companilactobacillus mishanensis]MQS90118.1 type II CRISPR RNA-guided endonuclease Cas9 [Companilactobacillus mishanensis]